jgi:hypothetical protein
MGWWDTCFRGFKILGFIVALPGLLLVYALTVPLFIVGWLGNKFVDWLDGEDE